MPSARPVLLLLACLAFVSTAPGRESVTPVPAAPPPLLGRVEGGVYHSATGAFSIRIPVMEELGGSVADTDYVVTFRDAVRLHASIACFPMDATQRWENETRGRKDYLVWFFTTFVQTDFAQRFKGARVESARFLREYQEGALLVYNLLPGGTMFADKVAALSRDDLPPAKRGNLVFVRGGHIYVVSTELAERVVERSTYALSQAEEDDLLRRRLFDLVDRIQFNELKTAR